MHAFRGHEFRATYLQATRDANGAIVKRFACQECHEELADEGRQAYQCKLCDLYCHKKCYTDCKPCAVSVGTLDDKLTPEQLAREQKNSIT